MSNIFSITTPVTLAYQQYQCIRHILPFTQIKKKQEKVKKLLDIADLFDNFFFDAYGVLNTADGVIPNAIETVEELQRYGKNCFIISNASGFKKEFYIRKFKKLGFNFPAHQIIVSRDVIIKNLKFSIKNNTDILYGIIGSNEYQEDIFSILPKTRVFLPEDKAFAQKSEIFLFLGSMNWNEKKQIHWCQYLAENPREIWVGNPDLIAPNGLKSSIEAGTYTLLLDSNLYSRLKVCGKPFKDIYQLASEYIDHFLPERTVMVGDTLHTDILGGNHFGIKTALVVNYGFFKGLNYFDAILDCQIEPDFILESI